MRKRPASAQIGQNSQTLHRFSLCVCVIVPGTQNGVPQRAECAKAKEKDREKQ